MQKTRTPFLWGSATAAYQCEGAWDEGGRGLTQWDVFSHESSRNINQVTGDVASDFYHRFEQDIQMLAESGQNSLRFSIAWTRILPDESGRVNPEGIEFYNKVIDSCLEMGVVPNVTLQHYDLPLWLAERGGWASRQSVDAFAAYAKACFEAFGDRVPLWVTTNEIRYYAHCCYLVGNYPPHHEMDFDSYFRAMYHGVLAGAKAVGIYRSMNLPGQIGIVHPCGSVETLEEGSAQREARDNAELYYVRSVLDPAVLGTLPTELYERIAAQGVDTSFLHLEDANIFVEGTVDFVGLNVYTRHLVQPYDPSLGPSSVSMNNKGKGSSVLEGTVVADWFATDVDPSAETNQWGREVRPRCSYDALRYIASLYPDVPLYITECGHASYDEVASDGRIHDQERIEVMDSFFRWAVKAYDEGIDLRGIYLWSTFDLYSWVNGYAKRYGLVYVDFDRAQDRIPKDSYFWYRSFIQEFEAAHEGGKGGTSSAA